MLHEADLQHESVQQLRHSIGRAIVMGNEDISLYDVKDDGTIVIETSMKPSDDFGGFFQRVQLEVKRVQFRDPDRHHG